MLPYPSSSSFKTDFGLHLDFGVAEGYFTLLIKSALATFLRIFTMLGVKEKAKYVWHVYVLSKWVTFDICSSFLFTMSFEICTISLQYMYNVVSSQ